MGHESAQKAPQGPETKIKTLPIIFFAYLATLILDYVRPPWRIWWTQLQSVASQKQLHSC